MSPGVLQNLSLGDVAIAALLVFVNGAVSVLLKLDLERKLAWAAVRTVVQLLAIGYVLGWVFAFDRWYVVLPLMALMTLIAGFAGAQRGARTYMGQRIDSIMSIWVSAWLVAAVGLFAVIRIRPWYEPQYAIPILGMILGNTLTGVSLGVERMMQELTARRDRVESALALGATPSAGRFCYIRPISRSKRVSAWSSPGHPARARACSCARLRCSIHPMAASCSGTAKRSDVRRFRLIGVMLPTCASGPL